MNTASRPFTSPEEFFAQWDLYRLFNQWAANTRRRSAMTSAGLRLDRCEHVPTHALTMLAGFRPLAEETRAAKRIRKAVVQSFRHEGLAIRCDIIAVYWGRSRVRVHVGVLEPQV